MVALAARFGSGLGTDAGSPDPFALGGADPGTARGPGNERVKASGRLGSRAVISTPIAPSFSLSPAGALGYPRALRLPPPFPEVLIFISGAFRSGLTPDRGLNRRLPKESIFALHFRWLCPTRPLQGVVTKLPECGTDAGGVRARVFKKAF